MFSPAASLLASSSDIPGADIHVAAWAWIAAITVLLSLRTAKRHELERNQPEAAQ